MTHGVYFRGGLCPFSRLNSHRHRFVPMTAARENCCQNETPPLNYSANIALK